MTNETPKDEQKPSGVSKGKQKRYVVYQGDPVSARARGNPLPASLLLFARPAHTDPSGNPISAINKYARLNPAYQYVLDTRSATFAQEKSAMDEHHVERWGLKIISSNDAIVAAPPVPVAVNHEKEVVALKALLEKVENDNIQHEAAKGNAEALLEKSNARADALEQRLLEMEKKLNKQSSK